MTIELEDDTEMAAQSCEVARLIFSFTEQPEATPSLWLSSDGPFDIGRKHVHDLLGVNDLTISTHHLRFRSVVYSDNPDDQIEPMVYVRVLSSNAVQLIRTDMQHGGSGDLMRKTDPDVLLNHGDILQLTPKVSILFSAVQLGGADSSRLDDIQVAETRRFGDQFLVSDRKLGSGGQGKVFVAVKQSVGRQVACKVIEMPSTQFDSSGLSQQSAHLTKQQGRSGSKKIERTPGEQRDRLAREFNILKDLSHPNIIMLEKVICATYHLYIFQELITGGDLLSYVEQRGALSEPQAVVIVRQILKAVDYLHSNGIVHRDIKPENVLMTSCRDGARVVLTDFGLARTVEDAKITSQKTLCRMTTAVGTRGYIAPEMLRPKHDLQREGYSKAIDIWAIGCITATLLTNDLIFPHQHTIGSRTAAARGQTLMESLWDINVVDHAESWSSVGRKAKSFIRGCLVLDESQRLTAKQALLHQWFTNKHYAAEMEAVYERAIQDWTPRSKSENLIQVIDTSDVVPASSGSRQYIDQIAEEVKSHHFENLHPSVPMTSAFAPWNIPQKRKATALPGIAEDAKADDVQVPATPSITQLDSSFTKPLQMPDGFTQFSSITANGARNRFSIEDFAPPETQLGLRHRVPNSAAEWNDSLTQTQLTLGDRSVP